MKSDLKKANTEGIVTGKTFSTLCVCVCFYVCCCVSVSVSVSVSVCLCRLMTYLVRMKSELTFENSLAPKMTAQHECRGSSLAICYIRICFESSQNELSNNLQEGKVWNFPDKLHFWQIAQSALLRTMIVELPYYAP